jgi:sigma-B regulation protein RsbU (phosphoserine phosphatase)
MGPGACVTCLYGVLDPADGRLELANAGYNAPYRSRDDRGTEPPSSDAPLGLALATRYEQTEILIQPGECLVFYSNGLIEASSARGEPFGLSRLQEIVDRHAGDGQSLIEALVSEFCKFTGRGWIQQDDVTLVVLERTPEGRPVQWKPGNGHGA